MVPVRFAIYCQRDDASPWLSLVLGRHKKLPEELFHLSWLYGMKEHPAEAY